MVLLIKDEHFADNTPAAAAAANSNVAVVRPNIRQHECVNRDRVTISNNYRVQIVNENFVAASLKADIHNVATAQADNHGQGVSQGRYLSYH